MLSDAVGLGVFTAIGANAAMSHHVDASFLVVSMESLQVLEAVFCVTFALKISPTSSEKRFTQSLLF